MDLAESELARVDGGRLQLNTLAARIRWTLDGLTTADHHRLRCTFACSVRAVPADADRAMLREVFLAQGPAVTVQAVVDHFAGTLRAAAQASAGRHGIASLLDSANEQLLIEPLAQAARKVAFSCGLEIAPPFMLTTDSASYAQDQLLQMQRRMAEQHSAQQVAHLQQAGELLARFEELRRNVPGLSADGLLDRIGPADRGPTLQALLMAGAHQQRQPLLYIASGSDVHAIDTRKQSASLRVIASSADLGPLRSVQSSDGVILAGARGGLLRIDPAGAAEAVAYYCTHDSDQGFNSAVRQQGRIVGCHSAVGVVVWEDPAQPVQTIDANELRRLAEPSSPTAGPRFCTDITANAVVVAVGHRLVLIDAAQVQALPAVSQSTIVGIVPDSECLWVVHDDGTVAALERISHQWRPAVRRTSSAEVAAGLPWLGSVRLLIGHDDGRIDCIGTSDGLVTRYQSPYRGVRMIAATADQVVAVSADRQRLTIWNSWDGDRAIAEIHVTGLTRHRIADVYFCSMQ